MSELVRTNTQQRMKKVTKRNNESPNDDEEFECDDASAFAVRKGRQIKKEGSESTLQVPRTQFTRCSLFSMYAFVFSFLRVCWLCLVPIGAFLYKEFLKAFHWIRHCHSIFHFFFIQFISYLQSTLGWYKYVAWGVDSWCGWIKKRGNSDPTSRHMQSIEEAWTAERSLKQGCMRVLGTER